MFLILSEVVQNIKIKSSTSCLENSSLKLPNARGKTVGDGTEKNPTSPLKVKLFEIVSWGLNTEDDHLTLDSALVNFLLSDNCLFYYFIYLISYLFIFFIHLFVCLNLFFK